AGGGAHHHQIVATGGGRLGDVATGGDARAVGIEDFHLRREIAADGGEEQPQDVARVGGEGIVAELIGWGERARGGSAAGEGQRAGRLVQELPGGAGSAGGGGPRGAGDDGLVAGRGGRGGGEAE